MPKAYVLERHKLVFVSVAKNACTSIKWLVAELSGQDPDRFHDTLRLQPTRRQTIHNRSKWEGVATLRRLDPAARARISTENGWFVFGVVRDPRLRVWSAWQSKFLVRNPYWEQTYSSEPWFPRIPTGPAEVIEDFAAFVRHLAENPGSPVLEDNHFAPQTSILRTDKIPYTRLYDITEIPVMLRDLDAHLRSVGQPAELSLGRENDTPLGVRAEVFGNGVRETIESIYAADLEEFGARWDFERSLDEDVDWPGAAYRDIAMRAAMGQRITDLAGAARHYKRRVHELEKELAGRRPTSREGATGPDAGGRGSLRAGLAEVRRRVAPRRR